MRNDIDDMLCQYNDSDDGEKIVCKVIKIRLRYTVRKRDKGLDMGTLLDRDHNLLIDGTKGM